MTVSIGSVIQDTDYNGLVSRVRAVLGNGTGQSGYGQLIPSLPTVADNSVQNIAPTECIIFHSIRLATPLNAVI
jgi:hypothetical protein